MVHPPFDAAILTVFTQVTQDEIGEMTKAGLIQS